MLTEKPAVKISASVGLMTTKGRRFILETVRVFGFLGFRKLVQMTSFYNKEILVSRIASFEP